MSEVVNTPRERRRVIGRIRGADAGPTLLCIGAMHGNEPAGVEALGRVCEQLDADAPMLRGEFVALTGNVSALRRDARFIHTDLNRHWIPAHVDALRNGTPPADRSVEDGELLDLLSEIDDAIATARGDVYFIDLHTTSGDSPPFSTIGDNLRNRALALQCPASIMFGLEEQLDGTLLEFLNRRGHVTMGFEGGRHNDPRSVDYAEAFIWIALAATGILSDPVDAPHVAKSRTLLREARGRLPRVLEVRHRHPVRIGDGFQMRDGYSSFQRVAKGEHLAHDHDGLIHAPESGRILMPLYQPQGDDGFFVMREFGTFWLVVSALLRRMRADLLFRLLPGVRHDPANPMTLVIDRHIARFYALEVFHLLGYRKRRVYDDVLVMSRR